MPLDNVALEALDRIAEAHERIAVGLEALDRIADMLDRKQLVEPGKTLGNVFEEEIQHQIGDLVNVIYEVSQEDCGLRSEIWTACAKLLNSLGMIIPPIEKIIVKGTKSYTKLKLDLEKWALRGTGDR